MTYVKWKLLAQGFVGTCRSFRATPSNVCAFSTWNWRTSAWDQKVNLAEWFNFFGGNPPILFSLHQGLILIHVEKEILINLNQHGLQPPIHIYPPHHHDLGEVDTHSSGYSWNCFKNFFLRAFRYSKECLITSERAFDKNLGVIQIIF